MNENIRNRISECATLFSFVYNGKDGNVDPYYLSESGNEYLLFFDGNEKVVYDINSVMNEPFFDGKSLNEIADEIEIDEF